MGGNRKNRELTLSELAGEMALAKSAKDRTPGDRDKDDTCRGCIGRGTGTHCCMCTRPIPPALRTQTDADVPKDSCADCRRGAIHTHRR